MMGKATILRGFVCFVLLQLVFLFPVAAMAGDATLSWSPPQTNTDGSQLTDLAGYKVYYGTSASSYSDSVDVGYVTSYKVSSLAEGSTYYFAVTAYNGSGIESNKSGQVSKTIPARDTTGPSITGILASKITTDSATISWATDEASDTQVEYGTTTSFGYQNPVDGTMTTAHSQVMAGLASSTTYYFRVISRDVSGNTTVSQSSTLTTAAPVDSAPPVISNVAVTDITANSARISWTTDEPSSTQVEYGSGPTNSPLVSDLTTVHSVTLTGLSSFTTYDYRVKSTDAAGNTGASTTASFKTSNMAPSVTSLNSSVTGGTSPVNVTLTAQASDTDGTIVSHEWDFDGDGVYDYDSGSSSSTTHTYSAVGTYNARVRIKDNGGATAESDPLPITVESSSNKPPVIVSITATAASDGSTFTFTFKVDVSDPNGSIVRYDWDFDGNGTVDASTTTSPAVYTYTVPGTYNSVVTVVDNQGGVAKGAVSVSILNDQSGSSGTSGTSTPASTSGSSGSSSGGGKCFIASAAYGSYLEPEVKVLRDFRDEMLLTNPAGKVFVDLYYRVSPPVADVISHNPVLKFAVRTVLTPVVYGIKYPIVSLAAVFMSVFLAAFRLRLKRRSVR